MLLTLKKTYQPLLSETQTELAIAALKSDFATRLGRKLQLIKVEAPLLLAKGTGYNDDLNGIEKPVSVRVKDLPETSIEIVQSLAKWKRAKLARLGLAAGAGIYTDMKALRPDEDLSPVHSVLVDQWDWEKVISDADRNLSYLKSVVRDIYQSVVETEAYICQLYPALQPQLPQKITFIHAEELQKRYPELAPKQRETAIAKELGAVFVIGIGGYLADGEKHDGRAPDYDDWSSSTSEGKKGLNGDILVWNAVLGRAFELSSMGIRVNAEALQRQLTLTGTEDRLRLQWHQRLISGELPQSIGGGIGQSRLAMLLLQKKHIGEVQSSIWSPDLSADLSKAYLL